MVKKLLSAFILVSLIFSFCVFNTSALTNDVPQKYDLRDDGFASSVKNQTPFGTCWDFAGTAAAESTILRQGLEKNIDLSEEAMLWNACGVYIIDDKGWKAYDKDASCYALAYCGVAASTGLYYEKDIPYSTDTSKAEYSEENRPSSLDTSSPAYIAKDIVYVDVENQDEIKQAIYNYGAVATGIYPTEIHRDGIEAYWVNEEDFTSHSVAVVGWDDNYPRENFVEINGQLPKNNGAWLIKNSYGTEMYDKGYMWVSFEDTSIFKTNTEYFDDPSYAFKSFEKMDKNTSILQNDIFGATNTRTDRNCMWASVLDFSQGKPYLSEVTFVTTDGKGKDYKVYYVPLSEEGKPVADKEKMTLLTDGVVEHNGYVTTKLKSQFELPSKKGAIAIEFDGEVSVGVSEPLFYASRGIFSPDCVENGLSYCIKDGIVQDFMELENPATLSIKAVTKDNSQVTPTESVTTVSATDISSPELLQNSTSKVVDETQNGTENYASDNKTIPTGSENIALAIIMILCVLAFSAVLIIRKKLVK